MTADPEIYALLGIAVFERVGPGNYRAVGEPPEWWSGLTGSWTKSFSIPFVEDYLVDAEAWWVSDEVGLSTPEVFQAESEGEVVTLDVVAASTSNSNFLLIRNLDIGGVGVTNVLQTARENRLRYNKEIDEHVELQVDLSRAKEAAELLGQAKTQFLANISHEIRTPLTAVLGMADLLSDTRLDEEQRTFVQTIQGSSDHLLRIINDLLDFSRVESGQFELESIPIDIRSFAEQTQSRFIARAKAKELHFDVNVGDDVPDTILGDPVRLAQIIDNLIGNALKFTSEGHIHAQFEVNPKDSNELLLLIADTGVGISPEKQELIFQSFVQEDASTTRRFGGTGLGLAIVRQLATVMNGDVTLESRPGKGTTFFVSLPIQLDLSSDDFATEQADDDDDQLPAEDVLEFDEVAAVVSEDSESEDGEQSDDAQSGLALETASLFESINWDEDDETAVTSSTSSSISGDDTPTDFDKGDSGSDWFGSKQKSKSSDWFSESPTNDGDSIDAESHDEPEAAVTASEYSSSIDELDQIESEADDIEEAKKAKVDSHEEPEWEPSLPKRGSRGATSSKQDLFDDEPIESFVAPSRSRKSPSLGKFRKPKNVSSLRVLLAEDNAAIQMLLMRMLKKAGHTVVTADNGKQAVDSMDDDIDLVLMDCQMPLLDGFEATKTIRELELENEKQRVPIIALTAHAMAGFREKCIAQGMDEYLTKPLNQSDLESVIVKTFEAQTL